MIFTLLHEVFPLRIENFQLMSVSFRKGFQRNLQDSIQMLGITTRNSDARFILGNTGHA